MDTSARVTTAFRRSERVLGAPAPGIVAVVDVGIDHGELRAPGDRRDAQHQEERKKLDHVSPHGP